MSKQLNFQYIGEYFSRALVGNFKQYVPQFSCSDSDSKNITQTIVLENKFYIRETKKRKK